jgi:hypothetical protein
VADVKTGLYKHARGKKRQAVLVSSTILCLLTLVVYLSTDQGQKHSSHDYVYESRINERDLTWWQSGLAAVGVLLTSGALVSFPWFCGHSLLVSIVSLQWGLYF